MIAVITGGTGFIGKHLASVLSAQNIKVALCPRLALDNPTVLEDYFKEANPDYIFHLAAYGNHSTQDKDDEIFTTNVVKTYFLLRATKNINYKALINFGSSSEYGKYDRMVSEVDLPITTTFYGASKVASSYIARAFAFKYNKPIVTVRPSSVYGSGEAKFRFIPTIINSLLRDKPITLDSTPYHDWIYINDLVEGVLRTALYADELKGSIINISTGQQFSNQYIVDKLEEISGKKLQIEYKSGMRSYDSASWVIDNTLLKKLGWKQKYTLKEGLKETYDTFTKTTKKENN